MTAAEIDADDPKTGGAAVKTGIRADRKSRADAVKGGGADGKTRATSAERNAAKTGTAAAQSDPADVKADAVGVKRRAAAVKRGAAAVKHANGVVARGCGWVGLGKLVEGRGGGRGCIVGERQHTALGAAAPGRGRDGERRVGTLVRVSWTLTLEKKTGTRHKG